jgi:LEA14-like dessication related protein
MKSIRAIAAGLLLTLLVGCAYTRLQEPRLQVVDVTMVKGDLLKQELKVRLRVQNPNDRALPIKGITYEVALAGENFAHGESESNFIVPANGEMEFDVGVTANAAAVVLRLLADAPRLNEVGYRITGKVKLSSGMLRNVPFDHEGRLRLR